ncbi:hypothetical protein FOVSG1_003261 [Fusarium oxysporum f. sp. vasinfectum]
MSYSAAYFTGYAELLAYTQRKDAIEIIQKKFVKTNVNVEVLNPEELLKDNDATGASNPDSGIAAAGGVNDQYNLGIFREIPRWKPRHTINFAAYAGGYPQPGDAEFAALRLWDAAKEWNSYELGVNFAWVGDLEKATFVLEYGGDKGSVLASAFFPSSQPLNTLFVYQVALLPTDRYRGMLKNIFLHELGHTLGLRHEFALDPDRFEGGAVVYGSRNEKSVMSYIFPPQVQPSDITDIQNFYKLDTPTIKLRTIFLDNEAIYYGLAELIMLA